MWGRSAIKNRAKGIQREEAAKLRDEQYKKHLEDQENYVTTRRLSAKLHKIYASEVCVFKIKIEMSARRVSSFV